MLSEHGITLEKNNFLERGVCTYSDTYGNKVVARREDSDKGEKFCIRLKFADENVKAAPLYVTVPITDGSTGQMLHLDYCDGAVHNGPDIDSAVEMYTFLLQRWIDLMYDINFVHADPKYLLRANEGATMADVAYTKYTYLSKYEELSELIKVIDGIDT